MLKVSGETKRTGSRLAKRSFRLPRDADVANARAMHVDGILTVTIPKKPAAEVAAAKKKRRIIRLDDRLPAAGAGSDAATAAAPAADSAAEDDEGVMV